MNENKYLSGFIDIYFALVFAKAIQVYLTYFEPLSISLKGVDIGKTLLFLSAVIVVVYDWVAYHKIIKVIPYSDRHWYLRFIVDLILFSFMFLVVHLVVVDFTKYVLSLAVLFTLIAIWHTVAYFQKDTLFEGKDIEDLPQMKDFLEGGMTFGYVAGIILVLARLMILDMGWIDNYWVQCVVAVGVIITCAGRYKNILKTFRE